VSESLMSAAYSHSLLDCCRFNAQDACLLAVYRVSARGNCASCAAASARTVISCSMRSAQQTIVPNRARAHLSIGS
jgi:tRNA(Ile2) C34 agmatinyltransferase TiaS